MNIIEKFVEKCQMLLKIVIITNEAGTCWKNCLIIIIAIVIIIVIILMIVQIKIGTCWKNCVIIIMVIVIIFIILVTIVIIIIVIILMIEQIKRNLLNQLHHPKFLLLLSEMNVIIATLHNYWNEFQSAQNSIYLDKGARPQKILKHFVLFQVVQNCISRYIPPPWCKMQLLQQWPSIHTITKIKVFFNYISKIVSPLLIYSFRMFWTFIGERKIMWKTKCGVNEFQWSAQNAVSATKALWSK